MTLVVHVAVDEVRIPISRERVAGIARAVLRAEKVSHALLSVAFLSDRKMAALNRRYLGRRGPTDVIAFGFSRPDGDAPVIGDIYIAPAVARANALAHGVPVREELGRVIVHGTLHVLGHDHPEDDGRTASPMWRRQERLLARALAADRNQ